MYHSLSCDDISGPFREYTVDKNLWTAYEVTLESMGDQLRSLLNDKLKHIDTPAKETKRGKKMQFDTLE